MSEAHLGRAVQGVGRGPEALHRHNLTAPTTHLRADACIRYKTEDKRNALIIVLLDRLLLNGTGLSAKNSNLLHLLGS